ncbi:MAG: phage baseplate assembly protein [Alphaproteobacteria bacterium]
MSEVASLYINNNIYSGWTSVSIERSIETISGGFDLSLSDRWSGQAVRWAIKPGDACEVRLDNEVVITGYVDDVNPDISSDSYTVSVSGRDKTGDLVDCSAIHSPDEWSNLSLQELATKIAAPFGINVKVNDTTGSNFEKFKIQQGEPAFEAIDRLCKMRAIMPISDGKGNIIITRAGTATASEALVEGKNLLNISPRFTHRERFSQYTVKAQAPGLDGMSAEDSAQVVGTAKDNGILRYRPLMIIADDNANGVSASTRAGWEATVRAARATTFNVSVQGWKMNNGKLWPINALTQFTSDTLGIEKQTLLIVSTNFSKDEQGTRTNMVLTRPDAYSLISEVKKGKSGSASGLPANTEYVKG